MDDPLQLGLFPVRGCRKPDCYGECEDGFDDGRVGVHRNLQQEVKLLQLPQEVSPLLSLIEGADALLPL